MSLKNSDMPFLCPFAGFLDLLLASSTVLCCAVLFMTPSLQVPLRPQCREAWPGVASSAHRSWQRLLDTAAPPRTAAGEPMWCVEDNLLVLHLVL